MPLLLTVACVAQVPVRLEWQHDDVTNVSFNVWHYTAVGATGTILKNVVGTNSLTLPVDPGVHFFTVTASNFWGESEHSNVVGTPGKANGPTKLTITR